jgi:radical SAM protein with 4Fe4S-binding SPASM domain
LAMEKQHYREFSQGLHQRLIARRIPLSGTIEVTHRCNLKCVHCYNRLSLSNPEARSGELTCEEHRRILDEIAEAGCLWILFTGGEIFARKDFLDIYTYAKQRGLLVTLFTNGTLITPQIADHLFRWRPFSIEITLYGCTQKTYEGVTGVAGSFERCMKGIKLLMEREIPLKLKTMAITLNKHELWAMKRFVEEEMGLPFKFDALINARIDGSRGPLEVRLSPEEVVKLDLQDHRRFAEWLEFCRRFNGSANAADRRNQLYHCGAGVNTFTITPSGMLSICSLSLKDLYDLRQGSLREGWDRFILEVRERTITRKTKCLGCGIRAMCGMCPGNGELENQDAEEPVDFLCRVAHLRAYAMNMGPPPHGDCEYCEGGAYYDDMLSAVERLRSETGNEPSVMSASAES